MTLREHIEGKLTDLTWCRVGHAAGEISRESHAGYWLEATDNPETFIAGRRAEVITQIMRLASVLDLTLAPADTHAANAALSGLHSIPEDDDV